MYNSEVYRCKYQPSSTATLSFHWVNLPSEPKNIKESTKVKLNLQYNCTVSQVNRIFSFLSVCLVNNDSQLAFCSHVNCSRQVPHTDNGNYNVYNKLNNNIV